MRGREPFLVIVLVATMIGSWATWALATPAFPHGPHHASFRFANGRVAIVLAHEHGEASHYHARAASHHDRDHVMELPGSSHPYSTSSSHKQLPHDGGPAILPAVTADFAVTPAPCLGRPACATISPPAPSRSNILRI